MSGALIRTHRPLHWVHLFNGSLYSVSRAAEQGQEGDLTL